MGRTKGKSDIPDETRIAITLFLAERSVNGRLKYGAATAAAARFGCCRQQAATIFKQKRLGLSAPTRGRPPASARLYRVHHMYDMIHINEKWFNMYKATNTFYLTANEASPYTSSPNKRYIGNVMFLAAVARPRYDSHRKCHFDGKIGTWPIVEKSMALRTSVNRPKGAIVMKCVNMTRSVYVKMLKSMVLPAIRMKWPGRLGHQDEVSARVVTRYERIRFGLFHSIQSLQYQEEMYTIGKPIKAVARAFRTSTSASLDHCFRTLQNVMETVIKHHGHNN
ncbi:hypothetical protein PHMEG_0008763 [Phytophthora megakarya]|uniref:Transposase n=1 Tax=Phytophthora megakarya TaxID=4795 RepID=A0A225WJY8_9STRA|nr:hypothetical protein PHMEG_0008763 [Phytophthora megakarya]